jgi:tetratricopeptide (TPR) repeat protein
MNTRCVISAFFVALVAPAYAQDDLPVLADKALVAMKASQWEQALALNTEIIDRFGKNKVTALQLHGPKFGVIHYRRGLCELKLQKWDEAMKSFEACYKDFPNKGSTGGNQFEKMALFKWGEAAMGVKNWKLALEKFQKFLEERDKARDRFPQGQFYVSMAICSYQLDRIPEGNQHLETAIKNRRHPQDPTPNAVILAGIQSLVESAVRSNKEQAILDVVETHRGALVLEPYEMPEFSKVYLKLAGNCVKASMTRAALALYQIIPSTDTALDASRVALKSMGGAPKIPDGVHMLDAEKLKAQIKTLESERKGKAAADATRLAAVAYLHEQAGSIRAAFAAYRQLEASFPGSAKREDNLFHLVRTAALVAPATDAQAFGERFLKDYPNSKNVPLVKRLMLSTLFSEGRYETCIEVAEPMLPALKEGTAEHDMCLHVLAGSKFYTGRYEEAEPLLDKHVEKYPKSLFAVASLYMQAANTSRLQYWAKAGKLLDAFIEKHPDASKNVFLSFAFYDRANCHFAEDQLDRALAKTNRVIEEFPSSNVVDQAYNLRGNIQQSNGEPTEAEKSYKKALEIAETRGNRGVAAEALYSLVALLGDAKLAENDKERFDRALPYARKYWDKYADGSPYRTRVAVAQMDALNHRGKGEDGLRQLRDVISDLAKDPEARGLEEVINSYTEFYLGKHSPEELKDHYYNFPGIRSGDRAARALLRVAIIGVFEEVSKSTKDEARARSANAMVQVLFRELKNDFALKDLTNFILAKVGDFLRTNTSTPREALPYYDEILSRSNQSYRFAALLGRADVYGKSSTPADLDKALEDFQRVYADSQDKQEREFSLYRMVQLLMSKGDHAKAAEQANIYLDREKTGFSRYSPEVGLLLGESFEKRNMVGDALAMYSKVWAAYMGNITVSAPAMSRWMKLSWERNNPSPAARTPGDRQGAYEGGARYVELTGRFKDKMVEADLELWKEVEALVKTYEANPDIKSLEQLKKEQEAKR